MLALCAAVCAIGTPAASAKAPFEFAAREELSIEPAELAEGVEIEILNNGTRRRTLRIRLSDLTLKTDADRPLSNRDALALPRKVRLPASGSVTLKLATRGTIGLAAGDYSARLTASNRAANTTIRRDVTIAVADPSAKVPPVPAVSKLSITATRRTPGGGGLETELDGNELPLDVPPETSGAAVAKPVQERLGLLNREGGIAGVTWDGDTVPVLGGEGLAAVLGVLGVDDPGDYSGTIDLLPADDEAGDVEVTLTVTDFILWPILALMLGIALGYAIKRQINVRRVQDDLRTRLVQVIGVFEAARADFDKRAVGKPYGLYDITDAFYRACEGAELQIRRLSSWRALEVDKEAHDAAIAMLGQLREVAKSWQPFGEELEALDEAVGHVESGRQRGRLPMLMRAMLQGTVLASLDRYAKLRERIRDGQTLLKSWNTLWDVLQEYRSWYHTLLQLDMSPEDKARLRTAKQKLDGAQNELTRIENAEQLKRFKVEEDLLAVEEVLSELTPPTAEVAGVSSRSMDAMRAAIAQQDASRATLGAVWEASTPTETSKGEPVQWGRVDWAAFAQRLRRRRFKNDLAVAAIALVTSLVAGLNALYVGKDFGTTYDYVNAVLWGLGTEGVLVVLFAAIARITGGPSDSSSVGAPDLALLASAGPAGETRADAGR